MRLRMKSLERFTLPRISFLLPVPSPSFLLELLLMRKLCILLMVRLNLTLSLSGLLLLDLDTLVLNSLMFTLPLEVRLHLSRHCLTSCPPLIRKLPSLQRDCLSVIDLLTTGQEFSPVR